MKLAVFGLWHLGSVTAARGRGRYSTIRIDLDAGRLRLSAGEPPLYEPGLSDLVQAGLAAGTLAFSADLAAAGEADVSGSVTIRRSTTRIAPTSMRCGGKPR